MKYKTTIILTDGIVLMQLSITFDSIIFSTFRGIYWCTFFLREEEGMEEFSAMPIVILMTIFDITLDHTDEITDRVC